MNKYQIKMKVSGKTFKFNVEGESFAEAEDSAFSEIKNQLRNMVDTFMVVDLDTAEIISIKRVG